MLCVRDWAAGRLTNASRKPSFALSILFNTRLTGTRRARRKAEIDELKRLRDVGGWDRKTYLNAAFWPYTLRLGVMNMRIIFIAFMLLCALPARAAEAGFDIKGVPLGATEADLIGRFPGIQCRDSPGITAERMCSVLKDSYGGAEASLLFALIGGKVSNMSARFKSKDFAEVIGAMRERLGPPTSEKAETVTNRAGAKFENITFTWERGGEVATARRYAGALDRASVVFLSEASVEEFKRRAREQQRERAKDL